MREVRERKKNSGFTLVEVLIAVAILAVVSIPVFQSFVSVAQVNAKSRRRLSATTIAENLMESCKGTSLLEVGAQCNGLAPITIVVDPGASTFSGSAQELVVGTGNALSAGTPSQKTVTYDSGYKFHQKDACAFWIKGIKSGGSSYDAVVMYNYMGDRSHSSDTNITQMEGNGVRVMRFYKVTITVYRSASAFASLTNPLATLEGSVADYSK